MRRFSCVLRIISLLTVLAVTVRGQNHPFELSAGTNYTSVNNRSSESGIDTIKKISPHFGFFVNVTYLRLPMKHNWSFNQGIGLALRRYKDSQLVYFYTLNKYYTKRYFDFANNIYCLSFSFLFKHDFTDKISLAFGL